MLAGGRVSSFATLETWMKLEQKCVLQLDTGNARWFPVETERLIPQWPFLCLLMMTIEMKSLLQNNTFVQISRAGVTIC